MAVIFRDHLPQWALQVQLTLITEMAIPCLYIPLGLVFLCFLKDAGGKNFFWLSNFIASILTPAPFGGVNFLS